MTAPGDRVISVRVPETTASRIEARAALQSQTTSEALRHLIDDWLNTPHDGPCTCPIPSQTEPSTGYYLMSETPLEGPTGTATEVDWWCATCGGRTTATAVDDAVIASLDDPPQRNEALTAAARRNRDIIRVRDLEAAGQHQFPALDDATRGITEGIGPTEMMP